MQRGRVCEMVRVLRPVRGVQIDGHVRIVVAEQARHRPGLGRLQLHVVAVQVVALGVRPLSHPAERPVLAPAVGEGHPLVPVRVVDRRDQQHHRFPPLAVPARQKVAQQHLKRLLPAHLARVDVALQVDDRLAGSADGCRARVFDVADHGQRERSALGRVAVGGVVDHRRGGRRALEEVHNIGVGAGFAVVGALGAGKEGVVRGRGASAGRRYGRGGRACRQPTQGRTSGVRIRHACTAPFRYVCSWTPGRQAIVHGNRFANRRAAAGKPGGPVWRLDNGTPRRASLARRGFPGPSGESGLGRTNKSLVVRHRTATGNLRTTTLATSSSSSSMNAASPSGPNASGIFVAPAG